MKTSEIRSTFLEFFRDKGHTVVPSATLVPANDPTLLFTNSGMVQFKNVFLGSEKLPYMRAADVQRCLRTGGKHNDLDSVGYTARHHTFFEMLGNWSFGDYFKREAIEWAWELLTGVFKLPQEKLWVTVYHSDDESYAIWKDVIGVAPERIVRIGDKPGKPRYQSDNFWQMADTGPCGSCTEIFYDHGADMPGGPPGSDDEDGDRFIEIWNLVFMQYDRLVLKEHGPFSSFEVADQYKKELHASGNIVEVVETTPPEPGNKIFSVVEFGLSPLPAPCVDTGMGLERLAAVLQHVHSNYEIDLFQHLIRVAAQLTNTHDLENKSLRVIADHIRACAFLIVDGVLPSNEGRGYVLRRIIRRALRHGWMLGVRGEFFWKMVAPLCDEMGDAYPELAKKQKFVEEALRAEEQRFGETLERGMQIFDEIEGDLPLNTFKRDRDGFIKPVPGTWIRRHKDHGYRASQVFQEVETGKRIRAAGLTNSTLQGLVDDLKTLPKPSNEIAEVYAYVSPRPEIRQQFQDWYRNQLPKLQAAGYWAGVTVIPIERRGLLSISGEDAFRLYDTYGFPIDLTADIARERGLSVDMPGFERAMEEQRARARAASRFEGKGQLPAEVASSLPPTQFLGYESLEAKDCEVLAIVRDGRGVQTLAPDESAAIILDRTPFYAESGGQVGDAGALEHADGRFIVEDTLKFGGQFHGHAGHWRGNAPLRIGDKVLARIDAARRQATVLNHSATHLLNAALRQVLGEHVTQKGSLVAPDRLRFDFSHFQPIRPEDLHRIENLVNEQVRCNHEAGIHEMGYQQAIDFGAMALFGEKYGDRVRVLKMGEFSTELCGGTHVSRTGDIGLFKIVSESGVAAGVRRIEAVTGAGAMDLVNDEERRLADLANLLSANTNDVVEKLRQLLDRQKKFERELEALKSKNAGAATSDLAATARDIAGIKLVAARVNGLDAKALRDAVDSLKQKLRDCVVLLAAGADGKVALVGGVHGAALAKIKAGEVVAHVAAQIGGKGGGRPDMAQGGGVDSPALDRALTELPGWLAQKIE